MPFDPNLPAAHTLISSAELRDQFNGLKADYETQIATIPVGPQGPQGDSGPQGPQGDPGLQGPPFANAVVDSTTTLDPGLSATVSVSFSGGDVHFDFGIPRGQEGPQGVPGEVSAQQLSDALATTANNPSGLGPYGGGFSDPPTQAEMQDFAAYVEAFRAATVR